MTQHDEDDTEDSEDAETESEEVEGQVEEGPSPDSAKPMSLKSKFDGALSMLPLQNAPKHGDRVLAVKRGPGRPRKVEKMPQTTDLQYHAEMILQKQRFIQNDRLVQALERRWEPIEVIRIAKEEVAKEAAALEFQRVENEKNGRDVAQISSRRIEALIKVAHLEFDSLKIGNDFVDLKSEKMQKVFASWVETLKEAAMQTLKPEQIDLLFNRLQTELEGWEDRAAEKAIK